MILVIASCVLSNGPLVHFSASRSDGITSYGVAVRFDGARTRKVVPAGVLEFPELEEALQDVPLVAPGMLGWDDDDEDNYWEKFTTVITTYALAGLGGAYVGASPFLFGQNLVEEITNSLEREDVTTLYAELGGQDSIEWAGLSLDFDRRDQNLRPWTRLGAGWADGDDGGAWLRMGGVFVGWWQKILNSIWDGTSWTTGSLAPPDRSPTRDWCLAFGLSSKKSRDPKATALKGTP